MTGKKVSGDPLEAAEDYRRQRQSADARRSGFESLGKEGYFEWASMNGERLLEIAQKNGISSQDAQRSVDEYLGLLRESPVAGEFDDPNAYFLLSQIVRDIEDACGSKNIPTRDGVVFGVSPKMGVQAQQMPVLETEASIISVTIPFLPFCNEVSKLVACSLPHIPENERFKVVNDPTSVRERIKGYASIKARWSEFISNYAITGWLPDQQFNIELGHALPTRILLLRSLEVFAVAHEYGHHVFAHGTKSSSSGDQCHAEEYEADLFARAVSISVGLNDDPINFYAISGVGGVLILGALTLVERAKAMLSKGSDEIPKSETHPSLQERVKRIALLDEVAPQDYRAAFADARRCFSEIIDIIWAEIVDDIYSLHVEGFRPQNDSKEHGGWLPLYYEE
ncbi:MAG TPA: hypothetical protein VIL84_04900 [Devosiaceae bacterium]